MAEAPDAELQQFVMMQQAQAQMAQQISKLTGVCWEMCVDKPKDKMDYKSEQCMTNCVERFIDTMSFVTGRFQKLLSGGGMQ